jgi:hypothetical protein
MAEAGIVAVDVAEATVINVLLNWIEWIRRGMIPQPKLVYC